MARKNCGCAGAIRTEEIAWIQCLLWQPNWNPVFNENFQSCDYLINLKKTVQDGMP